MAFEGAVGRVERIGRHRIRGAGIATKAPIRHLDPALLLSAFLLTAFGLLMVYSSTARRLENDGLPERLFVQRQITFGIAGVLAMVVVATISYRRLKAWGPVAYGALLFLLALVLSPIGSAAQGAQRWINMGPFQFQPSELLKLAVVAVIALVLAERRGGPSLPELVRVLLLLGAPAALVYLQPDLGTILVLLAVGFGMLLVAGTRIRLLIVLIALGAGLSFGAVKVGILEDYQVARLTAFLDPAKDPQRTGYNLNQAKIAIGSGQLTGKGLFHGTQTNLDFVPEIHTDFIFTAVGEELGFVGGAVLLGLFALYLWRGLRIAMLSKDPFGSLLAAGIVSMVAFQVFVNIGMTLGVSPITGIPLPFISYGGSSLITMFLATGILLNVHMRRMI